MKHKLRVNEILYCIGTNIICLFDVCYRELYYETYTAIYINIEDLFPSLQYATCSNISFILTIVCYCIRMVIITIICVLSFRYEGDEQNEKSDE